MSEQSFVPHGGWAGEPGDRAHLDRYPLAGHEPWAAAVGPVEVVLPLPVAARQWFRQGAPSCTGAAPAIAMSIINAAASPVGFWQYDFGWLWCRGTATDDIGWTNCGRNTGGYLSATLAVLRNEGLPIAPPFGGPPLPEHGITEYRWIEAGDGMIGQMRDAIAAGVPVLVGSRWYEAMTHPVHIISDPDDLDEYVMPLDPSSLGAYEFGHAFALTGRSDGRQAFWTPNSWGRSWPGPLANGEDAQGAWVPDDLLTWLSTRAGYSERAVILDKPGPSLPDPPPPEPTVRCRGVCVDSGDCRPGCRCRRVSQGARRCRKG